jgi:folate-binding protein YgfZ
MNKKIEILKNRAVISISGDDKTTFLQGLLTNDINKVSENQAIYSFMLSPQGRFLYDFFIIRSGEKLLLDCNAEKIDEIIQKLSFFKFRSKVEIQKELDLSVAVLEEKFADEKIAFLDPRSKEMGYRAFVLNAIDNENSQYDLRRINLKIPDDSDLTADKSFPLEFGFDDFDAVDYKKGCYVGQETTARMHYKGTIRKKIFLVEILNLKQIEKGTEIEADDKKIGEVLSSIFHQDKLLALVLIKNLDNEGKEINLKSLKLSPTMIINS